MPESIINGGSGPQYPWNITAAGEGLVTSENLKLDAQTEEGTQPTIIVSSNTMEAMLSSIDKQLKIMNVHLSLLTDTDVKNSEV